MTKKMLPVLCISLLLPLRVYAFSDMSDYATTNFKETLESVGMELKNPDYEETDDQVTVYLFRSTTCQYALSLLDYFNSISDEYGKYFKIKSFDLTNDSKNLDLFKEVTSFLGEEQMGVPFSVIGKEHFLGYNADKLYEFLDAIMKEYNSTNRYDVFEEMAKQKENSIQEEEKGEYLESFEITLFIFLVHILIIAIVLMPFILISNKKIRRIKKTLNSLKSKF